MKKTALITGASGGFGHEFAKLFAKDGYDVILVGRDSEKLHKIAQELKDAYSIDVTVVTKDLSNPSSSREIYESVLTSEKSIDVLVNNAGFATHGIFAESDIKKELAEIQVNIVALTELTRLFLPQMIEHGDGKILNIASTAAFLPGPLMAVYYASKAYVLSFSEALANEMQGTGVSVTVLCPGPTGDTGFSKRAGIAKTPLFQNSRSSSVSVAIAGYMGLMQNKTVVVPGIQNRFLTAISHVIPRTVSSRIVRRLQQ